MNNRWTLAVIAVCGICCLGGLLVVSTSFQSAAKAAANSKQEAASILPQLIKPLNRDEFLRLADEEMLRRNPESEIRKQFDQFEKDLGVCEKIGDPVPAGMQADNSGSGRKAFLARTEFDVEFKNADALVTLTLIRRDKTWKIGDFRIEPLTPVGDTNKK